MRTLARGVTSVTLAHNVQKIAYPFPECVLSVLPVVKEAIVIDAGPHDDDTSLFVRDFAREHENVRVIEAPWPSSHDGLSRLVNLGISASNTTWTIQVQADELFDELDLPELESIVDLPPYVNGVSFGFRHYCGDFHHVFPFMYDRVIRGCRTNSNFRAVGDASEFAGSGPIYNAKLTVHHVGKVHVGREQAGAFKEFDFQSTLYGDLFETDPLIVAANAAGRIDYFKVFAHAVEKGEVTEWRGPWPKSVVRWAKRLGVQIP